MNGFKRYFQQNFHKIKTQALLLELFDRPHKGPFGGHFPHLLVPVLQAFTNFLPNLLLLLLRYSCPDAEMINVLIVDSV